MKITNNIVKKAQQGDIEAIDKIINECTPLIYYLAARHFSGSTESQDCTQVVMERVISRLHLYDSSKTTFSTWFYIVIKRAIANYKDQYFKHSQVELNDAEVLEYLDLDENEFHKRRLSDVEDYVGDYFYNILMLRLGFELSFFEIAEELNIPYHKAKRDFHEAHKKAKEFVETKR